MSRKEQEFLNKRIEKLNETIIAHYTKSKSAYIFNTLLGYESLKILFFLMVAVGFAMLLKYGFKLDLAGEDKLFAIVLALIIVAAILTYVGLAIKKLLRYKYYKHVIVSTLGIYIAVYCIGYSGPQWSLYEWHELKDITLKRKSPVAFYKLGDAIERGIAKLTNTQSFFMERWDGEEKVDLLSNEAVQTILTCYKEAKKSARRSKKKKEDVE